MEMLCDQAVNLEKIRIGGVNPLLYAATRGLDQSSMYLSLRVGKEINQEDPISGKNVFFVYLQKKDI